MSSPNASYSRWQHYGNCKRCGYALRNLPTTTCPECGQAFDPNDPETMSVKGWVNWLDRTLLCSPGWVSHAAYALPLLCAIGASVDVVANRVALNWSFFPFVALGFWWPVRLVVWMALSSYYGWTHAAERHWLHWTVEPAMMVATIALWVLEF